MRSHVNVLILGTMLSGIGTAASGMTAAWGIDESERNGAEGRPSLSQMEALLGPMIEDDATDGSGGFLFLRAAGSNLTPRDSDTEFSYSGAGCIQRDSTAGTNWFTMDVQVPDGAVLDFLRVYYYDNDGSDVMSELWSFDAAGGTTLIAEADSTGTPGYGSAGSGFFSYPVSNLNESLVVVVSIPGGAGANLTACAVRLRYQMPQ